MQTNILRSICHIIGGVTFAQTFVSLVSPKYPHWAWIVFAILCIASGVTYIICYRRDKKDKNDMITASKLNEIRIKMHDSAIRTLAIGKRNCSKNSEENGI